MKRTYLTLIIAMLVIGFAAVATNLMISGKLNIGFNENDFEVYFSKATLDGEQSESLISSDGKSIEFTSKVLTDIGDVSTLVYEVTNNSKQYDAQVKVTCEPQTSDYITLSNTMDDTLIEAQSEETGTLTATLKTLTTEEKDENITCKLEVSAVSRTSVEAQKEEETYSIGAYLYDKDDNELTNKYLVVYSNTPHYVETDNEGYFYVEGLERGIHEIYYMQDTNPNGLTKEEVKEQAIDEARVTTDAKKIEFENGEVKTEKESIGKEKDIITVKVETNERTYEKVIEDGKTEIEINKEGYTTILCNQKVELDENEKIEISEVAQDTECKLYSSIVDAMNDHNTNNNIGTMMMLNDEKFATYLSIRKELYFNLNGKNLTTSYAQNSMFDNYANATYYDAKKSGKLVSPQFDVITISGVNIIVNASVNIESGRSALRIYSHGENSTLNVTDVNITCNNPEQNFCVYATNGSETINIKNSIIKSTYGGLHNNGIMVLDNISMNSDNGVVLDNGKDGNLTVNSGEYNSTNNVVVKNYDNGTITINAGKYISENNSVIKNENGNININQTNEPMYLSSKAKAWNPVILDFSNIIIKAKIADKCTNNAADTTSGLCAYAEGDKTGQTASNGAIQILSNGIMYIDGGSYYGYHQGLNCDNNGETNIKNAYIYSKWAAILGGPKSTINICSGEINSDVTHFHNSSTAILNYSSSVKFSGISTNISYEATNPATIKPNYAGTCSLDN